MPNIPLTYASPNLRLGLLLEDEPQAKIEFSSKTGSELGIPDAYGGNGLFCVATITFPVPSGRSSAVGYKTATRGNADEWNILCSKALGRALKRCGYPDDTKDLKTLVLWRQREAEIAAIGAGTANLQLPPAQIEKAIEASGTTEDAVSVDDGEAPNLERDIPHVSFDDASDSILVDDVIADEEKIVLMRQLIGKLDSEKQKEVTAWARKQEIRTSRADLTHTQVDTVIDFVGKINGAIQDGHGSNDAKLIVELVTTLTDDEAKIFRKFCKDNGIDEAIALNAPGTLSDDDIVTLLGWLDAGS